LKGIEFRLGSGLKVAGSKKDLKRNDPSYVKYSVFGSEGSAKVIRMQEVPLDPLEPSKFRHKKVPRSSSSAVPEAIHHSPERESKSIPEEWVIPASISNWKNPKGYTIPLDKRLAADGRNLNSLQINDKFANLSEALYLAEHKARQAVETRANIQKELLVKQKEKMESDLRTLARIAKKKKEE
jgi:SNW domain-containing protein 1